MESEDEDSLLTPEDIATQQGWDKDYWLRIEDMRKRAKHAKNRRAHASEKIEDLSARWRGIEDRLIQRQEDYSQKLATVTKSTDCHEKKDQ